MFNQFPYLLTKIDLINSWFLKKKVRRVILSQRIFFYNFFKRASLIKLLRQNLIVLKNYWKKRQIENLLNKFKRKLI